MNLIRKENTWYPSIIDDFFNANWNFEVPNYSHSLPAVNIKEADKEFTLQIASPGLTKEDFEVSFEDNVLSIEVVKKNNDKEREISRCSPQRAPSQNKNHPSCNRLTSSGAAEPNPCISDPQFISSTLSKLHFFARIVQYFIYAMDKVLSALAMGSG